MNPERRKQGTGRLSDEQRQRKNAGQSYKMRNGNAVAKKKSPNLQVTCKCKLNCKSLRYANRLALFEKFYQCSPDVRGTYIMGLIQLTCVKRRRHGSYEDPHDSHRQSTIHYSLPDGEGNIVVVCKSTFMNTFDLTKKHLETIIQKKKSGQVVYKDMRTRTAPGKFTQDDKRLVTEHINSIPREESHYSRAKSAKEYMSPDLNVNRLYKAFLQKYPQSLVTYKFYAKVLKKDFPNVSFRVARSDTCRKCDSLSCEIKAQCERSRTAKLELEVHHRKAEAATMFMKRDIALSQVPGSTTSVFSVDLEQVMFVPTLTHSDMFYLSQLSCYNLGINFGDNKHSHMCCWHEGMAGRGGNEIASCLLRILNMGITEKRNVVVWSDNCTAQNKNRMIVFIYVFLVSCGLFDTIEHRYLVSGHSFLQCDRDFALIEKRKRKCAPMVPEDLHNVILSSTHTGRFEVVDMSKEKFFDVKAAADMNLNLKQVNISKVVRMKVDSQKPGILFTTESFSEAAHWKETSILKRGKTMKDVKNISINQLPDINKVGDNKKKHLTSMIPYLEDHKHQEFYTNLTK